MSNVRSLHSDDSSPVSVSFGAPAKPFTEGELKRAIAVTKRAIAKEEKRRFLQSKLDRLRQDLQNLTTPNQF